MALQTEKGIERLKMELFLREYSAENKMGEWMETARESGRVHFIRRFCAPGKKVQAQKNAKNISRHGREIGDYNWICGEAKSQSSAQPRARSTARCQ